MIAAVLTRPAVVAHRGYAAVAPENTLPAFAAAVAAGADWIEFDVRTTADGVPVVVHDRVLGRTVPGSGPVAEIRFDALRSLDAGSWFSPAYAGHRVPALGEVLDLLAPTGCNILLEVKPPATNDQVKALIAEVAARGLTDRTVVQSFHDPILHAATEILPGLRRGILRDGLDQDPVATARELGAVLYNPSLDDLRAYPRVVPQLQAVGVRLMPWTVNDAAGWSDAVELGLDGIITDHPAELSTWLTTRPTPGRRPAASRGDSSTDDPFTGVTR